MVSPFDGRLRAVADAGLAPLLLQSRLGLEKESLRVDDSGSIAQTDHPRALGAPLTHPYITTDYSEALLEFITPPFSGAVQALGFLRDAHRFVYDHLEDEYLWASSMPCVLHGEQSIRIARYGSSNLARMKEVYRRGLGLRYGRMMQVIAGVHFNFSFAEGFWRGLAAVEGWRGPIGEFRDAGYFALLRNLQRVGWIVPYLFGASPAICRTFLEGQPTDLQAMDGHTYYLPWATSLRMGDIGYQNRQELEAGFKACYDSLDCYVESLGRATTTPCSRYAALGVCEDGDWRQLNANILQIENEYYSTVRPKQIPEGNEKPVLALRRRGVRYVELRSLDLNVFDPEGVDLDQLRFLEALMVYCLLEESPPIGADERREIDRNEMETAHRGRQPGFELHRHGRAVPLQDWAMEVCERVEGVCELLDSVADGGYRRALARQREAVADPDRTPSARALAQMQAPGESFFEFSWRWTRRHREYFLGLPPDPRRDAFFEQQTRASMEALELIEAAPQPPFDEFLAAYFAQR